MNFTKNEILKILAVTKNKAVRVMTQGRINNPSPVTCPSPSSILKFANIPNNKTAVALVGPKVIVNAGAVIDPIKMSESYKRKLPQILKKSFEEHKKKQRKLRHAKRKTKL